MVAVEGVTCVVRGVMFCEGFDDVEFYERVVGEAVEREIGVACGVVVRCVVYYAVGRLGHYSWTGGDGRPTGSDFLDSLCRLQNCLLGRAPSLE